MQLTPKPRLSLSYRLKPSTELDLQVDKKISSRLQKICTRNSILWPLVLKLTTLETLTDSSSSLRRSSSPKKALSHWLRPLQHPLNSTLATMNLRTSLWRKTSQISKKCSANMKSSLTTLCIIMVFISDTSRDLRNSNITSRTSLKLSNSLLTFKLCHPMQNTWKTNLNVINMLWEPSNANSKKRLHADQPTWRNNSPSSELHKKFSHSFSKNEKTQSIRTLPPNQHY